MSEKPFVLLLGARSDLARALAHRYAAAGHPIFLAGRKTAELEADARDLHIRHGVEAKALAFDALAYDTHEAFYANLNPKPGIVFCVFGYLGEQEKAQQDWEEAARIVQTNYNGAASILHHVANDMEAKGKGVIVGISSVAGDRGRGSNYYYGSAKAGFSAFLSGLRNRLAGKGVHVLTVKPGFMYTAMTEGLELPPLLTAQPDQAAKDIQRAVDKKRNVVYTRWMWRYIMLIIRHIPEGIFKRMKL